MRETCSFAREGMFLGQGIARVYLYCQSAFDKLKAAMATEPVLKLPEFDNPFVVYTDASDRAIGGVLMQCGHPVAYESRKLNETEQRYSVHEKEMTAVVHCLRVWRHYLLGGKFVVYTDNVATSDKVTQKKFSPNGGKSSWQNSIIAWSTGKAVPTKLLML